MRSPFAAAVLASLLFGARAGAQQYDLRTFSLEEGLPSASVNAICEDTEGFLWVATDQGLARSQGSRFEAFGPQQGAPHPEATAMLPATREGTGVIWAGFRDGSLALWSTGRFTPFATAAPLPRFPVRALLPGEGHSIWLASRGGGVFRVDTSSMSITPVNDGLADIRISALVHSAERSLIAGTDSGVYILDNERWKEAPCNTALRGRRVLSLFADSAGVLVGTNEGWLELDRQLNVVPIASAFAELYPLALENPVCLSVLRSRDGDLWIGTPGGLAHLSKARGVPTLTTIHEANGLGHDLVRCLHQDRSGGIWAGTGYGGLSKFTSDAFLYFTERDGLGSRIVSAMHRTSDGLLYIATQGGGVARYDGRSVKRFGRDQGLPSLFITGLGEDEEGYLLAGTLMHGLFRLRNDHFERLWVAPERDALRIQAILRGGDKRLYVGTTAGLYHSSGRTFERVGGASRSVLAIVPGEHELWLATDSGLYTLPQLEGATIQRVDAVPGIRINHMTRDSKGSIWMASAERGLIRLLDGGVQTYGLEAGMQSLAVEFVLLDAYEDLWLGTRQGIHQVELDVLQEQVLSIRAYGPEDGFIGLESLRGAGMLDGDSSLWFGTVRGAIRYDQRRVVEDPLEPLVHLTDLQLFYERPDWSPWCRGLGSNGFPKGLELPHNKNHLTFAFTGISLAYPEKVRYRWYLEGYDPDWSPITATQRVTYSNIPPGEYTFKVMARNASGIWNEHPISYSFVIAPPFWRTNIFMVCGGIALALAVFGFIRFRERSLRRERERLERMVKIRTSQLAHEKERSDELLLNILPSSTAEELKTKGSAEAHRYESCTVLFSDFKGFTGFSSLMDSDTLVSELDHFFRLFDELCDKHGLEKIKTIGDAYMCAAGLPEPKATHARDAVLMGLGMIEAVDKSNAERRSRGMTEWPIRIGIHTGPVVAGVVGRKKFAYDIWGDTVNLASRMESHGDAGKVNISGSTYAQVMDLVQATPRGPIKVKGKGELHMYFVTGLKESHP